jgi:putative NIF3 family GTP cyclohydrolase 1 type 2
VDQEVMRSKESDFGWNRPFLTADLKYHQFYEAEKSTTLADIGHFESERYTKNYIVDFFGKKSLILQSFYLKKIQIQLVLIEYEYRKN